MAKNKFHKMLIELIDAAIVGIFIFVLVYFFIGQLLEITGDSMKSTLIDKEQIIAEKVSLVYKPLNYKEIVIFKHPENTERLLVKRVIALPEDKILLREGKVFINDKELEESYVLNQRTEEGEVYKNGVEYIVPKDSYVLFGDNRTASADSRSFGAVKKDLIVGRALLVYKPLKNFRVIEH